MGQRAPNTVGSPINIHLRYADFLVELINCSYGRNHRVFEFMESECLGVRIWELFAPLESVRCPW